MNAREILSLGWSERQRPMVEVLVKALGRPVPTGTLIDLFYAPSASDPKHQWSNIEKIKSNMNVRFRKVGYEMRNLPFDGRKNGRTQLVAR